MIVYQICKKCVIDNTSYTNVTFNQHGICSYCLNFDKNIKPKLIKNLNNKYFSKNLRRKLYLAKKLNNSNSIPMIYQVVLDQNITKEMMDKLKEGQIVFDKFQKVNIISNIHGKSKKEVGVEVHSLSPAIMVKLFSTVGVKVIQMDRVIYGGLSKKDLPRGNWRKLSTKEIGFMKMIP